MAVKKKMCIRDRALPETGVTDASTVTLLGAALGLVGLAGLAKRKRDENE